jgi:hypothetical protein
MPQKTKAARSCRGSCKFARLGRSHTCLVPTPRSTSNLLRANKLPRKTAFSPALIHWSLNRQDSMATPGNFAGRKRRPGPDFSGHRTRAPPSAPGRRRPHQPAVRAEVLKGDVPPIDQAKTRRVGGRQRSKSPRSVLNWLADLPVARYFTTGKRTSFGSFAFRKSSGATSITAPGAVGLRTQFDATSRDGD